MHAIIILTCASLVNGVPCKKRDPDALESGRRNEGFRYYFKTTTSTSPRSTYSFAGIQTITPREKICAPYQFNETICEYVGDRELCGYNKNPEVAKGKSDLKARELSNGCWLKKGRVECGYKEPFDTIRRPPVVYPNLYRAETKPENVFMVLRKERLVTRPSTTTKEPTTTPVPTTVFKECVEVHSRIVCRTTRGRVLW